LLANFKGEALEIRGLPAGEKTFAMQERDRRATAERRIR
jgi:hypothetical protein